MELRQDVIDNMTPPPSADEPASESMSAKLVFSETQEDSSGQDEQGKTITVGYEFNFKSKNVTAWFRLRDYEHGTSAGRSTWAALKKRDHPDPPPLGSGQLKKKKRKKGAK